MVVVWEPASGRVVCFRVDRSVNQKCSVLVRERLEFVPGTQPPRVLGCVVARPLVPVSSTPRGASTSGLSTTCSPWGLHTLNA